MTTKVVGSVNATSLGFKWEISNFCISCSNVGDSLISPDFTAYGLDGNIEWFLQAYPKGQKGDREGYLSLFLHTTAEIKTVNTNLKLLNNEGEVVVNRSLIEYAFDGKLGRGFPEFVSRDFIVNPINGILNDDKITIMCEIIMSAHEEKEQTFSEEAEDQVDAVSQLKVIDKYEALLDDSKFSDVSLISSEGKPVKVHKCILAKSSSVFAAMFDAEMKEKRENTVEIDDIRYNVLVEMVRFVYTGKANLIDALAGELAIAADKYELEELKDTCDKTMTKNLSAYTVIDCLQLADKLRMDKLKEKAIEFIVEKGRSDITDKPEFELLPAGIICRVCRDLARKIK